MVVGGGRKSWLWDVEEEGRCAGGRMVVEDGKDERE